jgi:acyl-CoA synthetase (AMP-forming)/AMP-acid ligase II
MNFCDTIFKTAGERPDHPALIEDELTISYRELAELASRWSAALQAEGLQPGDRVGICLRDSTDFAIAMLATAHAQMTFVPIDWRAPPPEVTRLAEDFSTAVVLREPGTADLGETRTLVVDEQWRQGVASQNGATLPAAIQDTPLLLNLTSGTTGRAKGAIVTHEGFLHRTGRSIEGLGDYRGTRYLSVLPLCFAGGSSLILYHLGLGNTIILYPPLLSAEELVQAVRDFKISFLFLVPTMVRQLLDLDFPKQPLFPELEFLMIGAAPMSATEKLAIAEKICPRTWEFYSTSATARISSLSAAEFRTHSGSVGKPSPTLDIQIVDANDQLLPAGELGRLRCRGPGVSTGYFGNPDQSTFSEKIIDGWYYTGDMAYLSQDGFLYVEGRVDDMIIRGGENIQPGIIESTLLEHPQIEEAAVIGRASRLLGQEPVAYVVTTGQLSKAEILTYCRDELKPNQVPADVRLLPNLPKTAAGKVQKRKLPD